MTNSNQVDTGSALNNYNGVQVVPLGESFAPFAFDTAKAFELAKIRGEYEWSIADPCKPGTVREIDTTLRNFFNFLKGIKQEGKEFINDTLGEVQNITYEISRTISKITSVLRTFTQRLRNFVLGLVRELIQGAIQCLLTPLLDQIKDTVLGAVLDQLMCKFDEIMNNLKDLVSDFLFALVNLSINNPAFCAIEAFANGLLNNLANTIDNAIGPVLSQINDLLGGAAQVVGSVFSVMDTILGYEGLLCSEPKCPGEVKGFTTGPWSNLKKDAGENFNNFKPSTALKNFNDSSDKWLNEVFPSNYNTSGAPCYAGPYECGAPQIVFFGGGGSGASANAIVNGIGQIIGVNLLSGGSSYKTRPFVSIIDPGGCGRNAAAYAEIDDTGRVTRVTLTNPGYDYSDKNLGGVPVINYFVGTPNPVQVGKSITLKWDVSNYTTLSLGIKGFTDLKTSSVSFILDPKDITFTPGSEFATKTYTLTATKLNQNSSPQVVSKTFTFTVSKKQIESKQPTTESFPDPSINSFSGNPDVSVTLNANQLITLSWKTSNADSIEINAPSAKYPQLNAEGSITVASPSNIVGQQKITYELVATNTRTKKVVRQVLNYTISSSAVPSPTDGTGGTTPPSTTPLPSTVFPTIDSFSGNPTVGETLNSSSTLTLSWQTTNADTVTITPAPPNNPVLLPDGSISMIVPKVLINTLVSYQLTATNSSNNQSVSRTINYTVLPETPSITSNPSVTNLSPIIKSFTGDPETKNVVAPGSIVTLSWQTENADQLRFTPTPIGNPTIPANGSLSFSIPAGFISGQTISYELTATNTNIGETVTKTLTYTVFVDSTARRDQTTPQTPTLEPETPTRQLVGVLDRIIVLDGGIGFSPSDQVKLDIGNGNSNGAELKLVTTAIGQIIGVEVLNPGYGFTNIPEVLINSKDGVGGKFLSTLKFVDVNEFLTEQKLESIDSQKLVKVVDCLYK